MKRVYISGPIRAPSVLEWTVNIFKAWCVARYYWSLGYAVICPHSNTAFMDRSDLPSGIFIQGDYAFIEMCETMIMMSNWKKSEGATDEHAYAITLGLEIIYLDSADVWRAIRHVLSPSKTKPRSWDFKKGE